MDARLAAAASLLLFAAAWPSVLALSSGSPNSDGVCRSLVPQHRNTSTQPPPSPYTLAPAQGSVARGEPVNLTLTSRHGFSFKGFLVQARRPDSQEPFGTFEVADKDNAKTIACLGPVENSVTHTNPSLKNSTSFEWTPPADFSGPVVFNATVVSDYTTYWTNVVARVDVGETTLPGSTVGISTTRQPLTTQRTSTTNAPVTVPPERNTVSRHHIYDGCHVTKVCFGFPTDCESKGTCDGMVAVLVRNKKYEFEMIASNVKYVAVGLSDDKRMDQDSVMECILMNDGVKLFQSWNGKAPPRSNIRINHNAGLELIESSAVDNAIYCKFTRDDETVVNNVTFDLPSKKYHLLLAVGSDLKDGGNTGVGFHSKFVYTENSNYLSNVNGFKAASNLLFRLHGALMIGAWIGAASIGIVLARYFKQTWTGSQMCGKDQWFAWHRLFMLLVWSLTIAAFVLIFVALRAWSSNNAHAILGVITTVLAFFQPIGAIFRPSPDHPRRPIFNWLHWLVGNCAHILGIVAIILAEQLSRADLPKWWIWIMVGYVAFHVLMHLVFSIAGCISERQNGKRINSFPMKEMSNSRMPLASAERKQEAPHSCFRKLLLAIYILGILLLTIALIVIVVLAPIEENIKLFKKMITNDSNV